MQSQLHHPKQAPLHNQHLWDNFLAYLEFDDILIDEPKESKKEKVEEVEVDPFEDLLAPTLPQEDEKKEEDIVVDEKTQEEEELDIQKELERKFDELFENIDGNVTTSQK